MTLEEMTVEQLKQQIQDEEKELKSKKKELLAKKIMIKTLTAQAERTKPSKPNRFLNKALCGMTKYFASVHSNASHALTDPVNHVALKLINEAEKLNAISIKLTKEDKKAKKFCLKCAVWFI